MRLIGVATGRGNAREIALLVEMNGVHRPACSQNRAESLRRQAEGRGKKPLELAYALAALPGQFHHGCIAVICQHKSNRAIDRSQDRLTRR